MITTKQATKLVAARANILGLRLYSSRSPHYDGTPRSFVYNESHYLKDSYGPIETVPLVYDVHKPVVKPEKDNAPLFMLHGIFGSKSNFRTVSKQLSNLLSRDVYCVDFRNFGASPHVNRLDYPSLAADVEGLIDSLNLPISPIIVGHSMGAKAGMALALRRPDIPKMLVTVDNAPVSLPSQATSIFTQYIKSIRHSIEVKQYTDMKDIDHEFSKIEPNKIVRQFVLANLKRGPKKNDDIYSKIPLEFINDAVIKGNIAAWPFDPNISRWSKGPTLFIRGSESKYVPDDYLPEVGKYFPNFELSQINSGHWVISEKPNEFIKVMTDFITKYEEEDEYF